jgi:formylglycine-generating enzyme required for sulfatase activity
MILRCLFVFFLTTTIAWGQDRTALIIAQSDYGDHRHAQAEASARSVEVALAHVGFRVSRFDNLDSKALQKSIDDYASSVPTGGLSIVYFVGFAGQYQSYQSKNEWWTYLQGAGKPQDTNRLDRQGLSLADVLKVLKEKQGARETLVVLDCCSTNPFQGSTHPAGLAPVPSEWLDPGMLLVTGAPAGTWSTAPHEGKTTPLGEAVAKECSAGHKLVELADAVEKSLNMKDRVAGGLVQGEPSVRPRTLASTRKFATSDEPPENPSPGEEWINGAGMVFCWCPAGSFVMGDDTASLPDLADNQPVEVTLSRGFWMGKYEVTQREYKRLRNRDCRDPLTAHPNAPFHNINASGAADFCKTLTEQERKSGRLSGNWTYALPTEAEWEYACRAGSSTPFAFGPDFSQLAEFGNVADASLSRDDSSIQYANTDLDDGIGGAMAIVGSYRPNAWGLHDMHGNVAEWCQDRYQSQLPGGVDPMVDIKSDYHVIRGGAWCSMPHYCASGFRNEARSNDTRNYIGFRVLLKEVR